MTNNIVVMPGPACFDLVTLHSVAKEFGWAVDVADDLREVAAAQAHRRTIAVLFHRDALGSCSWIDAVRLLRSALPEARPVACHGFAEPIDWPGLCDAGAFHALWLPLKEDDVRQSFGFVWEAEQRLAQPAVAKKLSATQRIAPSLSRGVRTHVTASAVG
ncbi:MAG: hypothetical protein ABSG41_23385 [Bryobacteraceae bacterium]|jgi:hypothetical protein